MNTIRYHKIIIKNFNKIKYVEIKKWYFVGY